MKTTQIMNAVASLTCLTASVGCFLTFAVGGPLVWVLAGVVFGSVACSILVLSK